MEIEGVALELQIFATDTDGRALRVARTGRFPLTLREQIPADLLDRFFQRDRREYSVGAQLRDALTFSEHSLFGDPPFSKLDLVSYRDPHGRWSPSFEGHVFTVFQYALRDGGYLVLGPPDRSSSTSSSKFFEVVNENVGAYRRTDEPRERASRLRIESAFGDRTAGEAREALDHAHAHALRLLEQSLSQPDAAPSVVVNAKREVVYFFGRCDRYLETREGVPSMNLIAMARPGLRRELASALRDAAARSTRVRRQDVRMKLDGATARVRLTVQPVPKIPPRSGLLWVTFEEKAPPLRSNARAARETDSSRNRAVRLQRDARDQREKQLSLIDALEASNEELQVANEELSSMNEELLVANEELVTAKEELQSINEEMREVNSELEKKGTDLVRASSDLKNLFESTQLATIFLDRELKIRLFTPGATDLFRVIEQDRGRALSDIARTFDYEDLTATLLRVLETLHTEEIQVRSKDKTYVMRVLPYLSIDRVIEGVTLTFTDVTQLKRAEAEIERARYERQLHDIKERTEEQLRRAERLAALGTFAAGLGHELNNPLSIISMSADYAQRSSEPEKLNKMLVAITANAKRCSRIVEGVMRFARDETSKKWKNDLSAITAVAAELARAYLPSEKLDLDLELARDLPQVSCNPTQLEQVVVNLIRNACEASTRLASVTVRTERAGAGVRLSVEDNGPGIPPDHLAKVFDPFHSTRRNKGGTGLGLSIAHRVVTDHGGTIHAFNRPQGGAAFVVELPAAGDEAGVNGRGELNNGEDPDRRR